MELGHFGLFVNVNLGFLGINWLQEASNLTGHKLF